LQGGDLSCIFGSEIGCGTVFKIDSSGSETTLYAFTGRGDGRVPAAGVIRDAAGNLYGTTEGNGIHGAGTVFKLDATGKITGRYSFTGGAGGEVPVAGLIRDTEGNLYGTTLEGGAYNYGAVFKLRP